MLHQDSLIARYNQTIDYLYSRLPMFERVGPVGFKKDLTNILALCKILGNPERKFKSIHIAGTNGKGSVSHMLSSVLMDAGYKTGLYISPHYKDFRERIRVDGKYISRKKVIDFVDRVKPFIPAIKPSFFELTVAMAFDHFASQNIECAVVETGLGGRLDSTNILHPILTIITNISFDHQNMLGYTIEKIASEKAGIMKSGVPCVIGEYQNQAAAVFKAKAAEVGIKLSYADKKSHTHQVSPKKYLYIPKTTQANSIKLNTPLLGVYQEKNINTVINALQVLNQSTPIRITTKNIKSGLIHINKNAPLMGRCQIIGTRPTILADAAHNIAGLSLLFKEVSKAYKGTIHCIFGTVRDKDVKPILEIMPKSISYYFVRARIPRAMDDQDLTTMSAAFGLSGVAAGTVKNGLRLAKKQAGEGDLILVTGSIFVVGEIL